MSLTLLLEALELKDTLRAGWVRAGVTAPESVAGHSWGVAWLVMSLCPDEVNRERAMMMALIHDLAEVRVGDLTPHDPVSREDKHQREAKAMRAMMAEHPRGDAILALFEDYETGTSLEAKWVRTCDRLDMVLQALRYEKRDGLDLTEFLRSAAAILKGEPTVVSLLKEERRLTLSTESSSVD